MYIDEGEFTSLGAIGASMDAFAASAAAGQFAVNQQGGDALLAAIRRMTDWIDSKRGPFGLLEQEPPLGSSNAAKVMKPYMQQVAVDHQGFLTQLYALYDSLVKAEQAIIKAMENYRQTDEGNADELA
ncbi:hypothetical protein [Actinokineospora pegani]|uniref:hypothetical protein n=1 Tax=Actinokineospora pegani TaxID=2654637 RepID=UPI0012EADEAE|nr:hypothetical protein [Actinokineospora pegani]